MREVVYTGKTRRGAGLIKGETYEVVDSSWKSMLKIRTSTGAEPFVPICCFAQEPLPSTPVEYARTTVMRPTIRKSRLDRGRRITEIKVLGLHLALVHK
jgi:hypothetical protein